MSRHEYSPDCPGCRPVVIDPSTGCILPEDSAAMRIVNTIWDRASEMDKRAWHAVTCLNSRAPLDLALSQAFVRQIQRETSKDVGLRKNG